MRQVIVSGLVYLAIKKEVWQRLNHLVTSRWAKIWDTQLSSLPNLVTSPVCICMAVSPTLISRHSSNNFHWQKNQRTLTSNEWSLCYMNPPINLLVASSSHSSIWFKRTIFQWLWPSFHFQAYFILLFSINFSCQKPTLTRINIQ